MQDSFWRLYLKTSDGVRSSSSMPLRASRLPGLSFKHEHKGAKAQRRKIYIPIAAQHTERQVDS